MDYPRGLRVKGTLSQTKQVRMWTRRRSRESKTVRFVAHYLGFGRSGEVPIKEPTGEPVDDYTYQGCFVDLKGDRVLSDLVEDDGPDMTTEVRDLLTISSRLFTLHVHIELAPGRQFFYPY